MIPFFRERVTVNALSCWFTDPLELLTTTSVCACGLDRLPALTEVVAPTSLSVAGAVIGLVAMGLIGLTGVDAVTALSSARLSRVSTCMGVRRREL
jgi:hypothetical protein